MKYKAALLFLLLFFFSGLSVKAIQRFPRPEFETAYSQPETLLPHARAEVIAVVDVVVLALSLSLVSWLVLKKRSRKGVFWMSLFSLAYFGFYREGCVCSIGSIQNVTLALFDHTYILPLTVIVFFILPLVFALFFGRTFCAGVCPFGALQDMVAFYPQKTGPKLNGLLGMVPYLYLGFAILYAATGTDFIICRYDPFVGIFRMNATFSMFLFGGLLLVTGIFLARPYCRFLCPYGVLLNWASRLSRRHLTITADECIRCRLCENSCPYDAIDLPLKDKSPETRTTRIRKMAWIVLLIPVLTFLGAGTGFLLHRTFAGVNKKVILAKQLEIPANQQIKPEPFAVTAFRTSGKNVESVNLEAREVIRRFKTGASVLGGFIGLAFALVIARRMTGRWHDDYLPDKGHCFSCVRCIDYCPVKTKLPQTNQ